jgi:hypothetical protein
MRERLTSALIKDLAIISDFGINKTLYEVKNSDIIKVKEGYRNIGGNALNEKNIKNYHPC